MSKQVGNSSFTEHINPWTFRRMNQGQEAQPAKSSPQTRPEDTRRPDQSSPARSTQAAPSRNLIYSPPYLTYNPSLATHPLLHIRQLSKPIIVQHIYTPASPTTKHTSTSKPYDQYSPPRGPRLSSPAEVAPPRRVRFDGNMATDDGDDGSYVDDRSPYERHLPENNKARTGYGDAFIHPQTGRPLERGPPNHHGYSVFRSPYPRTSLYKRPVPGDGTAEGDKSAKDERYRRHINLVYPGLVSGHRIKVHHPDKDDAETVASSIFNDPARPELYNPWKLDRIPGRQMPAPKRTAARQAAAKAETAAREAEEAAEAADEEKAKQQQELVKKENQNKKKMQATIEDAQDVHYVNAWVRRSSLVKHNKTPTPAPHKRGKSPSPAHHERGRSPAPQCKREEFPTPPQSQRDNSPSSSEKMQSSKLMPSNHESPSTPAQVVSPDSDAIALTPRDYSRTRDEIKEIVREGMANFKVIADSQQRMEEESKKSQERHEAEMEKLRAIHEEELKFQQEEREFRREEREENRLARQEQREFMVLQTELMKKLLEKFDDMKMRYESAIKEAHKKQSDKNSANEVASAPLEEAPKSSNGNRKNEKGEEEATVPEKAETKGTETQTIHVKSAETKAADTKTVDTKATNTKATDNKAKVAGSADAKVAETKTTGPKVAEAVKAAEAKKNEPANKDNNTGNVKIKKKDKKAGKGGWTSFNPWSGGGNDKGGDEDAEKVDDSKDEQRGEAKAKDDAKGKKDDKKKSGSNDMYTFQAGGNAFGALGDEGDEGKDEKADSARRAAEDSVSVSEIAWEDALGD